jgi:hypothetical protein
LALNTPAITQPAEKHGSVPLEIYYRMEAHGHS